MTTGGITNNVSGDETKQRPSRGEFANYRARGADQMRRLDASMRRGRIWVVVIFVVLRAIEALLFFGTSARNSEWAGVILASMIWTTGLLVAIWRQRSWARYILIVAVSASSVGFAIFSTAKFQEGDIHYTTSFILALAAIGHAAVAVTLGRSSDIKQLTNQARRRWYRT